MTRARALAPATQSSRVRWSVVGLGVSLLLLTAGLGVQAQARARSHPRAAPVLQTARGARLVLQRQTVRFAGAIAGGVACSGTLWPSLPGLNSISLRIVLPGHRVAQGGRVRLVLTMPPMAMRPVRVTLTAGGGAYRGRARLPMFGRYRAQVDAATATGRYRGILSLTVPLALASA